MGWKSQLWGGQSPLAFRQVRHVERHQRGIDVGHVPEDADQAVGVLSVQQKSPTATVAPGRDQHAHLCLPVACRFRDHLERGPPEATVGDFDHLQGQLGEAQVTPTAHDGFRPAVVHIEVDRVQFVRV